MAIPTQVPGLDGRMNWRRRVGEALIGWGSALATAPTPDSSPLEAVALPPGPPPREPPPLALLESPVADADDLRQLFHQALVATTPESLVEFVDFCARFRRHSIFNTRLIQVQRRGAKVCATAAEWRKTGRHMLPDAQPIIVLKTFGPIAYLYDIEDTGPPHRREEIGDPFAATATLGDQEIAAALERLRKACASAKQFRIDIVGHRLGWSFAGSAAGQGALPVPLPDDMAARAHNAIEGALAAPLKVGTAKQVRWVPSWRVKINDRMTPAESFVTVAHELGHIFCGHLGECGREGDTAGWPSRMGLSEATREMEAEAVAWLVASRAGFLTGSATYLRRYVTEGNVTDVSTDLVVRAAGRIESMAALRY